nr:hypothetical protein CFP56_11410 [Quercus suber]
MVLRIPGDFDVLMNGCRLFASLPEVELIRVAVERGGLLEQDANGEMGRGEERSAAAQEEELPNARTVGHIAWTA